MTDNKWQIGVNIGELFTDTWSLDDAKEAYEKFDKQTSGKSVIVPN